MITGTYTFAVDGGPAGVESEEVGEASPKRRKTVAKSSEKADKVFLINTILAGRATLMAAAASRSAKECMSEEDRVRLEDAITVIREVQDNL